MGSTTLPLKTKWFQLKWLVLGHFSTEHRQRISWNTLAWVQVQEGSSVMIKATKTYGFERLMSLSEENSPHRFLLDEILKGLLLPAQCGEIVLFLSGALIHQEVDPQSMTRVTGFEHLRKNM